MEPFFSGVALGLAILIPLALLIFTVRVIYLVVGGLILAVREIRKGGTVAERQERPQVGTARADAAAWQAWLEEARQRRRTRNERQLAWMDRHWPTAWYARLYRRIFHYPSPGIAK